MELIILTGLPASGKSTLGQRLSAGLGMPILEKDDFKEALFDALGFQSREEKVALGVAAMDIMYRAAARILDAGGSVILDNNFENTSKPGLLRLMEEHPCATVMIRLTGDMRAVYERFLLRDRDPSRHLGHVLNDRYPPLAGQPREAAAISYDDFCRKFRERGILDFSVGVPEIDVDVTDPASVDFGGLLERVKAALGRSV